MGSSQHGGWCKKHTSPTNARATLKGVRKATYTIVLFTITAVTGATGTCDGTLVPTLLRAEEEKAIYQSDVYSVLL